MNHVELSGLIAEPVVAHKVNRSFMQNSSSKPGTRIGQANGRKNGTPSTAGIVWRIGQMRICIRAILWR